jgi:ankyrin repeat protein
MSKSLKSDRYVIKDIDDDVSISSEEDERGVQLSDSNFYCNTSCQITVDGDHELWDFCEIESGLRELPNANVICDMFNNEDKLNAEFMSNNTDDVNTILLFAVWYKKPKTVYRLLNEFKADANAADSYGRTALHLACFVGDPLSTEYLIYNAADPQNWDRQLAMTPLHCAAASGNLECLEQLLVAGVDVNIGFDRYTSLYYAVHRNNKDCVEALLKNGANPNCTQPSVFSPLHVAVSVGYIGCVRTLLKYKANIEASYGERKIRALHIAASENYIECLELLLEAGADTEARTINDQTALHLACLSQNHDAVQTLIDYGADVHARYKDGRTSLHASLVRNCGSWGCTAALLKAKCDVNLSDDFGYTPLHIAALNEFSDCAIMLIEYGADLTAKTNGGVTAMSFVSRRTPEVLQDFRRKLDVSINAYSQHEIGDIDCEIKLDFRLLVPNKERGETELLKTFIENGHRKILKHPLCETFLYLKWSRIRKFFLFSLIFYAVFGVVFTTYVLGVYQKCDNTTVIESANGSGIDECISKKQLFFPLLYIALVLNFCVLVGEIYQMANGLGNYVRYWGNWLQCATIIGVFLSAVRIIILEL